MSPDQNLAANGFAVVSAAHMADLQVWQLTPEVASVECEPFEHDVKHGHGGLHDNCSEDTDEVFQYYGLYKDGVSTHTDDWGPGRSSGTVDISQWHSPGTHNHIST